MDIEFKKRFAKAFEKSGCVPKLTMRVQEITMGKPILMGKLQTQKGK